MTDEASVLIDAGNTLGEGPLWHPKAERLFWFDIIERTMFASDARGGSVSSWTFDDRVSAAGWIDETTLLIASERALFTFDVQSGRSDTVIDLEADNPNTRSNDGRADPRGGFWIGTMGLNAERDAGAIYRYCRGNLVKLMDRVTVPNSICFSPDGETAYFTDSRKGQVMRWGLDPATGDPVGTPSIFVDLSGEPFVPDGSVTDADGFLWNAEWRGGRVTRYRPDGTVDRRIALSAPNATCPAFGGPGLQRLFVTSARQAMSEDDLKNAPQSGALFSVDPGVTGWPEPRVLL